MRFIWFIYLFIETWLRWWRVYRGGEASKFIVDNSLVINKIISNDIKRAVSTDCIVNEKLNVDIWYTKYLRELDKGFFTAVLKNTLSNNNLTIGQNIKIRTNSIVNGEECFGTEDANITYNVQKGDTLYDIARRFGVSVSDLMKSNSLSSSNLKIGQVLIIPMK